MTRMDQAVRGMCANEQRVADEMKEAGVSRPLSHEDLRRNAYQFFCGCSDGAHASQLFSIHAAACGLTQDEIDQGRGLLHPVFLNGGALCFSPTCKLAKLEGLPQDFVGIMNFAYAMLMKGQHGQVSLYTHSNCGAAKLIGLPHYESYDQLLRAKYRLRRIFNRTMFTGTIGAYFLLCEQVGDTVVRESRHIHKRAWEAWLDQPAQRERYDRWHEYKRQVDEDGLGRDLHLQVFDELIAKLREHDERELSSQALIQIAHHAHDFSSNVLVPCAAG